MQFLDHLLKNFFVRDIIFLLGGSIFLYAIIENTNLFPVEIDTISGIRIFLFLGFAYILGYVIQEVTAVTPFTTTKVPITYCNIVIKIHKCIHKEDVPSDLNKDNMNIAKNYIDLNKDNEHIRLERERIILFKNIGMTIGPSLIYSALFYSYQIVFCNYENIKLGLTLMMLGIVLIILGWVKTVRLALFLNTVYGTMDENQIQKYIRRKS